VVNWAKVRLDFPITKRMAYLDHASCGPMPKPVYDETRRYYEELGGYADFSWSRWIKRREEVRQKVARFIHASPREITFTSSTSQGMNLIAELISGEGAVLTNTLEFPATTVPWVHRKAKLKFLSAEKGTVSVDRIRQHLTPKIKTILTSFVQFQNGFRQDLEAIGRVKGNRYFVVNATQGFGYLPIDVKRARIDFLATNCYKWMMAGYGSGILYVNLKWLRRFQPHSAGWRSVPYPERFDNRSAHLKRDASRYEYGCPPFPHIFAIGAGIDYFSSIGISNIKKRIFSLTGFLISVLRQEGFEITSPTEERYRSGIVVFKVKNAEKMTNYLLKRRIYVSPRGSGIRVAPHMYNTEQEIELLMNTIKEAVRRK